MLLTTVPGPSSVMDKYILANFLFLGLVTGASVFYQSSLFFVPDTLFNFENTGNVQQHLENFLPGFERYAAF
eukprot:7369879-Prymnesium_polylepis.1